MSVAMTEELGSSSNLSALVPMSRANSPGIGPIALRGNEPVGKTVKGLTKLLATGVLVYLTYVFTLSRTDPGQPPDSLPEEGVGARSLLALSAGEAAPKPGPLGSPPAANTAKSAPAKPEAVFPRVEATAQAHAVATFAPPRPARGSLTREQVYKAVCQACHGVDGKGEAVRKAMPEIPDFTEPKWQLSRADSDLIRSISEGKGQLMLPMKDKLSKARIETKEMVALVRAFMPAPPVIAPASGSPPRPGKP